MFLAERNNPGARLNEAYSGLVAGNHPREAYNAIVDDDVGLVSIENLPGRIAANSGLSVSARNPDAAVW
ncbi:hypothetical protein ACLB1N_21495 [Escherichia coli]